MITKIGARLKAERTRVNKRRLNCYCSKKSYSYRERIQSLLKKDQEQENSELERRQINAAILDSSETPFQLIYYVSHLAALECPCFHAP